MWGEEGRKVLQMVLKFAKERKRFFNVMWFSNRQKQDFFFLTVDDRADTLGER